MSTFVLVIFFWETARGYAVTTVPGYLSLKECQSAAQELNGEPPRGYYTRAVCITGPRVGAAS